MKKASIVNRDKFFNSDRLFDLEDKISNRDNCLFQFNLLQTALKQKGYLLSTSDVNSVKESEIVFYNEMPKKLPLAKDIGKSYLMLLESELIRPDNWMIDSHKYFNKIFTWNDEVVDNIKYFKTNFSYIIPDSINKDLSKKKKLCTLIAGNKMVNHPLELYSKRIEVIRWFERFHPDDFDLYGVGWDRYRFSGPKIVKALNKLTFLTKLFSPTYPSYRGRVISKKTVLEKYKFSICFENAKDIPGYITEKIFDCFFAGCIPVYLGASNVSDHIPKDCYIDMREFTNYEEMYGFLVAIKDEEYSIYLNNIENFILSEAASLFSASHYVETIVNQVIDK